jgi:exopolysaccharide biosynthesis polyprenyl glycosylphosphotransferase
MNLVTMDHATAKEPSAAAGRPQPAPSRLPLQVQRQLLVAWLLITDAVALMAALRTAYWIRFDLGVTIAPEVVPDAQFYPTLAALLPLLWLAVFYAFRLYDTQQKLGGLEESAQTFQASTTATMLVIVATFVEPAFVVSRMWLISAWLLSFLAVATSRFAARRIVYALRRRGFLLSPAVIIGMNEESAALAASLADGRGSGVRLVGILASASRALRHDVPGVPFVGTSRDIVDVIRRFDVEEVIVAITAVEREELLRICEDVNDLPQVHLRLSSGLYELLTTRVAVHHFGTLPLLRLDKVRLTPGEAMIKSLVEIPLALGAVVVAAPVLLAIALIVKLDSPGPVLHRRYVLGAGRKPFAAFKFRTMCVDGDAVLDRHPGAREALQRDHKLLADPRITRVGRWLRALSLDELPQLFNVLLGQMSLVGPRMIVPDELEKYGRHRLNLHTVKPGITGLWQVSGRSDLSYEDRVRIDMYYVRNYTIWMDLQILFIQTLPAVLKRKGAY